MTLFNKFTSVIATLTLVFGAFAVALPITVDAASAPRCVLNTIVQPFNNGGTTLSWKVYDAQTITITGVGTVTDADSIIVYPNVTTAYTLTATGKYGVDTCTVTAQPTSAYSFSNPTQFHGVTNQTCSMWVNPDYVVPGGTAILSWNAGSATHVSISGGIGNVSNDGSRTVPNIGVPQTFTLTAKWSNGATRTCDATVLPLTAPTFYGGSLTPQITATYTPTNIAYVPLNQVPYTGTSEVAYVLTLLAVTLGAFTLLYRRRNSIASTLVSFSPTDNDDYEIAVEQSVIHEA